MYEHQKTISPLGAYLQSGFAALAAVCPLCLDAYAPGGLLFKENAMINYYELRKLYAAEKKHEEHAWTLLICLVLAGLVLMAGCNHAFAADYTDQQMEAE